MRRPWLSIAVLSVILTALGEFAVWTWSMLPTGYWREAEIVDDAYVLLLALAVPVFAFVIAMLVYSAVRFRTKGPPTEDGPPMTGSSRILARRLPGPRGPAPGGPGDPRGGGVAQLPP